MRFLTSEVQAIKEEWRRYNARKYLGRCWLCLILSYASFIACTLFKCQRVFFKGCTTCLKCGSHQHGVAYRFIARTQATGLKDHRTKKAEKKVGAIKGLATAHSPA